MSRFILVVSFVFALFLSVAPAHATDYFALSVPQLTQKAEAGDADAQFYLAFRYGIGEGVPQDTQQSIYWTRKSAELGNVEAQLSLGIMLWDGRLLPKDAVLGYALFHLSAARGNKLAVKHRDTAVKELTSEQIKEGKAIASQWKVGQPFPTTSTTSTTDQ